MKRILVLGGTGFIGRNLIEQMSKDKSIEIVATYLQREPWTTEFTWIKADLTSKEGIRVVFDENGKFDLVIQAAATTSGIQDTFVRPDFHVTDNAVMNALILREVNAKKIPHFVFFSCTTMLPSSNSQQDESGFDGNDGPVEKYFGVGWTKVYIEKLCEFYSRFGNTKFSVIRHSNIYGPWDRYLPHNSHVCGATISKVLSANEYVTIWGPGNEYRDLLFVGDLCELVKEIINKQKDPFCLVNAGGGVFLTVRQLTEQVMRIAGKSLDIRHDLKKPSINFSVLLDNSKAWNLFAWEPRTPLETGLKITIDFWKKNYDLKNFAQL